MFLNKTFHDFENNLHTFCVLIGICSMCGKKVLDTKNYKQTSV